MLLKQIIALGLFAATAPAFASSQFTLDFETNWTYGTDINDYYNGGTASDGTSGTNYGVSFSGVSGLSNDALGPYYSNAPSPLGVAYAHTFAADDKSFLNVASGVDHVLSFFYASTADISGAVKAYSGLNGTGTLLGTFDLSSTSGYDAWTAAKFSFSGTAKSFDLTGSANVAAFDNISAVPFPAASLLFGAGLVMVGAISRRVNAKAAI